MKHSEIFSKDNNKLAPNDTMESNFEYHEVGKQNKYFVVIHRMVLDQKSWDKKKGEHLQGPQRKQFLPP